jgi:hypothetical protein
LRISDTPTAWPLAAALDPPEVVPLDELDELEELQAASAAAHRAAAATATARR